MKNKKIVFVGLVFVLLASIAVTANAASKVSLKVKKQGNGVIKSDDGKINCGSDCKEVYYSGGSIHLYATSAKGFSFDKWTGNACGDAIGVGISTSTEITIGQCQVSFNYNNNKTITAVAHFKKISGTSSSSSKSSKSFSSKSYSSKSNSSSSVPKLTKEIILQLLKDYLFDNKCSSEKIVGEYGSCSIDISKTDSKWIITAIYDGLYDDSIKAIKIRATVTYQDKQWFKRDVSKTQQCWPGRGHQDFSSKPCL